MAPLSEANVDEFGSGTVPRTLKPTEEEAVKLSARNRIPAKVTRISQGEAIVNVEMDANGQRIVSSITAEAVRELGLAEGSDVQAVIKASDVMVAVED